MLLLVMTLRAQQAVSPPAPPQAESANRSYLIFLQGRVIGREDVTVKTDATGTTITAQGAIGAPRNTETRRAEVRYTSDWTLDSLTLEGTIDNAPIQLNTTVRQGVASSQGIIGSRAVNGTQIGRAHV